MWSPVKECANLLSQDLQRVSDPVGNGPDPVGNGLDPVGNGSDPDLFLWEKKKRILPKRCIPKIYSLGYVFHVKSIVEKITLFNIFLH